MFVFIFIYFPWEAAVLFKHLFKRSMWPYVLRSALYTLLSGAAGTAAFFAGSLLMPGNGVLSFIVRFFIVVIIFGGLWWIFTHSTPEYAKLMDMAKGILRSAKNRKKA